MPLLSDMPPAASQGKSEKMVREALNTMHNKVPQLKDKGHTYPHPLPPLDDGDDYDEGENED